jgi:hypothetical protein
MHRSAVPEHISRSPLGPDATKCFPPALENMGTATFGHPVAPFSLLDSPLLTPPRTSVFVSEPNVCSLVSIPASTSTQSNTMMISPEPWMTNSSTTMKRAIQRRVEVNYSLHKKANNSNKFKIATDAGGKILTNKLRVTSTVKSLMEMYLDVAQVHYVDNDEKFIFVE